jgi:DNA replication protein DnaC
MSETQNESTETEQVLAAIVYLADRCDGANAEDGAGFNAFDADNGHRMAALIREGRSLSMIDYQRALSFCRKYKKQLSDRPIAVTEKAISPNREGLNEQQAAAFDGITQWFSDRNGSRQSLLVGYAGTGKTFTVQRIAKELAGKKICFTSPTHKANQVLSQMAYQAGLQVEVMTIHSLLGLSLQYDKFGKQRIIQKSDDKSYKYDFVVLDEGSMVSTELNEFIEGMQARYLVMGDPAQLPPIENDETKPSISPVFDIPDRFDLTKVVRYDGAIYKYVTDIRENIAAKKLPFHKYELGTFDKFASDEWMKNVIERYKKAHQSDEQDPNGIRALAWTNKRVQDINSTVRAAIYGSDTPYTHNERLVAKDLIELQHPDGDWRSGYVWATGSNTVLMHSCDECVIKHFRQGIKKVFDADFEGWYLDVLTDLGDRATIFIVDESEKTKVMAVCGGAKKAILDTHLEHRDRAEQWAKWYKGLNELGLKSSGNSFMRKLQYAFALTIHQSQGSTFKTVFADASNVFGCQDTELRNKLLYVQGSRASHELYLLNNF